MTAGTTLFLLTGPVTSKRSSNLKESSLWGLGLMLGYLGCDGFTSTFQVWDCCQGASQLQGSSQGSQVSQKYAGEAEDACGAAAAAPFCRQAAVEPLVSAGPVQHIYCRCGAGAVKVMPLCKQRPDLRSPMTRAPGC